MKLALSFVTTITLIATSVPAHPTSRFHNFARRDVTEAVKAIEQASPTTASCDGAAIPDECATATDAAPHIIQAFGEYNVTSPNEWAALLSLMLFESAGFKYNRNHFPAPGRPGQGTRNMQMIASNTLYVQDLADQGKLGRSAVAAAGSDPNSILALVLPDEHSFASASWYYATQCSAGVKQGVQAGTQQGYEAYLTQCVQTTVTQDRISGWQAAMKACG